MRRAILETLAAALYGAVWAAVAFAAYVISSWIH